MVLYTNTRRAHFTVILCKLSLGRFIMSNKNSSVDSCETFDKELSTPITTGTSDAGFAGDLESGSEKKPIC